MRVLIATMFCLCTLSACMNVTLQLQPERQDVKAVLTGSDCVPMFLGLALGTATVEAAQRNGARPDQANYYAPWKPQPIVTVRTVRMTYQYFLIGGEWCVEVTGE